MYRLFCYMVVGLRRPFLWQIGKIENTAYKKENKTKINVTFKKYFGFSRMIRLSAAPIYMYFQRPQFSGKFTYK